MTMREKMARAMCVKAGFDPDKPGYLQDQDGRISHPPIWGLYLVWVDTMLDAMLEPTVGMILAICEEAKKEQCRPISVHRTDAYAFLRAGINAARDGK